MSRPSVLQVLLSLAVISVPCLIFAQSTNTSTLSVSTRLVVLDVVVTDKSGNVVNGLSQDDFTVYEDQAQQSIRFFERAEQHQLPADVTIHSTEELQKKAPDAPVNILVLDEFNTRFEDMAYARYSIKKYIGSQPAKLTVPTQFVAISTAKFEVLLDYTQDGNSIVTALNKHLTLYPWHLINNRTGEGTIQRLALSLGALEQVAEATKGHPGRKNVIWIGHGFPGISTIDLPQEQALGITGAVQKALNMLRDARITLYTIDPTAVSTQTVDITDPNNLDISEDANGNDPFAATASFHLLAPATGGRAFYSRNDVDREIGTSIRDGANYYTLSYSPSNKSTDAAIYRRIAVKMNRPGLTATTRNGYYGQDTVAQPVSARNQLAFDINSAASTTMAYTGLAVTVAKDISSPDGFMVRVDPRGLGWKPSQDGSQSATLIVEAVSFGAKNKYLGKTTSELTLGLKSLDELRAPNPSTSFSIKANLAAGTVRVRFVVRDSMNGHIGTADCTTPWQDHGLAPPTAP